MHVGEKEGEKVFFLDKPGTVVLTNIIQKFSVLQKKKTKNGKY